MFSSSIIFCLTFLAIAGANNTPKRELLNDAYADDVAYLYYVNTQLHESDYRSQAASPSQTGTNTPIYSPPQNSNPGPVIYPAQNSIPTQNKYPFQNNYPSQNNYLFPIPNSNVYPPQNSNQNSNVYSPQNKYYSPNVYSPPNNPNSYPFSNSYNEQRYNQPRNTLISSNPSFGQYYNPRMSSYPGQVYQPGQSIHQNNYPIPRRYPEESVYPGQNIYPTPSKSPSQSRYFSPNNYANQPSRSPPVNGKYPEQSSNEKVNGVYPCGPKDQGKTYSITGLCYGYYHCIDYSSVYRECNDSYRFDAQSGRCVKDRQCYRQKSATYA